MTIIGASLDQTGIARVSDQASVIGQAATFAIAAGRFLYFAAFDGTNNDRNAIWKSGNSQSTNVGALQEMVVLGDAGNPNFGSNYYGDPGTYGVIDPSAAFPTSKINEVAERAYKDFSAQASEWLEKTPGGEIEAAFVSSSRGGTTAAVFSQLLYERGLVNPATREILIAPGQIGISVGIAYDPVTTGFFGNIAFAPNVRNIVVVQAENEYREFFKAVDYSGQPGVTATPHASGGPSSTTARRMPAALKETPSASPSAPPPPSLSPPGTNACSLISTPSARLLRMLPAPSLSTTTSLNLMEELGND